MRETSHFSSLLACLRCLCPMEVCDFPHVMNIMQFEAPVRYTYLPVHFCSLNSGSPRFLSSFFPPNFIHAPTQRPRSSIDNLPHHDTYHQVTQWPRPPLLRKITSTCLSSNASRHSMLTGRSSRRRLASH